MNVFRIVLGEVLIFIAGVISLILWHKKIDSKKTWIYGIYISIIFIVSLFVLIELEQYWQVHG
mgnify:FL=1